MWSLRAVALAAAVAIALLGGPRGASAADRPDRQPAAPGIVLVGQTAAVDPGGTFDLAILANGLPTGARITTTVHDRVRSRSELATSTTGAGLRRGLHTVILPLSSLPADASGARHVSIPLTVGTAVGKAVNTPGVYPVEVAASEGTSAPTSSFVTDLIVRPPASASGAPLDVAVLAEVDAPPRSAAHPTLDAATVAGARGLVAAVAAAPDLVTTLAVRPEVLEALAGSTAPEAVAAVAALRALAAAEPVLALPYVATSPDALAAAGIATELAHQMDHGTQVLQRVLGTAPRETTWLSNPDLSGSGLALLSALGIGHALVDPDQVETVVDGVLTPARPFLLTAPSTAARSGRSTTTTTLAGAAASASTPVEALVTDDRLAARLTEDAPAALVSSRVLADLATLWFEQPSTPRAIVLPIADTVDGAVARQVLAGLRSPTLFHTVALDAAFTAAAPLRAGDGTPLRRSLRPAEPQSLSSAVANQITTLRALRESVQAMVGPTSPILAKVDSSLLRSMALGLTGTQQRAEIGDGHAAVQSLADAISTPDRVTITLTARDGKVPLTIRNDTGAPVVAEIHLRSPKLELPGGSTIPVTLTGPSTRLDIAVRTRASGAFPFDVEVTSPDGRISLASTTYSVRSTAISGVGLILSVGAGLFLVVWWARHWREAWRSAKLVASPHPAVSGRTRRPQK